MLSAQNGAITFTLFKCLLSKRLTAKLVRASAPALLKLAIGKIFAVYLKNLKNLDNLKM